MPKQILTLWLRDLDISSFGPRSIAQVTEPRSIFVLSLVALACLAVVNMHGCLTSPVFQVTSRFKVACCFVPHVTAAILYSNILQFDGHVFAI